VRLESVEILLAHQQNERQQNQYEKHNGRTDDVASECASFHGNVL
jgi:hypothetical protein